MQIKTTMRYHYMPVRMAAIQKSTAINAGEGVEKREPSYTVAGNANRTDFWTLWEKARVGCFVRTASEHVYYL